MAQHDVQQPLHDTETPMCNSDTCHAKCNTQAHLPLRDTGKSSYDTEPHPYDTDQATRNTDINLHATLQQGHQNTTRSYQRKHHSTSHKQKPQQKPQQKHPQQKHLHKSNRSERLQDPSQQQTESKDQETSKLSHKLRSKRRRLKRRTQPRTNKDTEPRPTLTNPNHKNSACRYKHNPRGDDGCEMPELTSSPSSVSEVTSEQTSGVCLSVSMDDSFDERTQRWRNPLCKQTDNVEMYYYVSDNKPRLSTFETSLSAHASTEKRGGGQTDELRTREELYYSDARCKQSHVENNPPILNQHFTKTNPLQHKLSHKGKLHVDEDDNTVRTPDIVMKFNYIRSSKPANQSSIPRYNGNYFDSDVHDGQDLSTTCSPDTLSESSSCRMTIPMDRLQDMHSLDRLQNNTHSVDINSDIDTSVL
jgi:hypothetical protein